MQAAWQRYAAAFPSPAAQRRAAGAALLRRYQSRGRHYHDLRHIAALLALCDQYQARLRDPHTVRTAIWFHDAIYATRRPDNEERSAALALHVTTTLGQPAPAAAALILATQRHRLDALPAALRPDAAWFLDFDLSILAAPPAAYDAYAQAIRREYYWVPARAYAAGRAKVLTAFLERPSIYLTAPLRRLWEKPARANLAREIQRLAQ